MTFQYIHWGYKITHNKTLIASFSIKSKNVCCRYYIVCTSYSHLIKRPLKLKKSLVSLMIHEKTAVLKYWSNFPGVEILSQQAAAVYKQACRVGSIERVQGVGQQHQPVRSPHAYVAFHYIKPFQCIIYFCVSHLRSRRREVGVPHPRFASSSLLRNLLCPG